MAREKGTFNFSANLEVKKQGPLDARQTMITYAELTQAATWQDEDGKMYLFNGLIVPVINDSEKQLYMLIDAEQYNQTASWKRIDPNTSGDVKIYDLTSLNFMSRPLDIEAILGKPDIFLAEILKKNVIAKVSMLDSSMSEALKVDSFIYNVPAETDFALPNLNKSNSHFVLYTIFKSKILYSFIAYNKDTNSYISFINNNTSISLLSTANITKKLAYSYEENEVASADVNKKVITFGDITSLEVGSSVDDLKTVFSNILLGLELVEVPSFSDIVSSIYESYLNFSDSLFYSVKTDDFGSSVNKLIKVDLISADPMASGSNVYIELRYIYEDESYTIGFSKESGVKTITKKWVGSDIYIIPGKPTSLNNESSAADIKGVYGNLNTLKEAISSNRIIVGDIGGANTVIPMSIGAEDTLIASYILTNGVTVHNITISGSDYVSLEVSNLQFPNIEELVQDVTAETDKGIEVTGDKSNKKIGIKIDTETKGNVELTVGPNGLKGQVELPTLETEVYKIPGEPLSLSDSPTPENIKGVYGDLNTLKQALTSNKIIFGNVGGANVVIPMSIEDTTLTALISIGTGLERQEITISDSDYVSAEITDIGFANQQNVVQDVTAEENKGIEVTGNKINKKIGIKIDETTKGNVELSVGANGLKADFKKAPYFIGNIQSIIDNASQTISPNKVISILGGNADALVDAINAKAPIFGSFDGGYIPMTFAKYESKYFYFNFVCTYTGDLDLKYDAYFKVGIPYPEETGAMDSPTIDLTVEKYGFPTFGNGFNYTKADGYVTIKPDNSGNVKLSTGTAGLKADFEESVKGVKAGDKVLKVESDKTLSSTLDLNYKSDTKKIQLLGIDNAVIAEIDATAFIKDGMINLVDLVSDPEDLDPGTYIKITFNTDAGKEPIFLNVTSLIDVYVLGNGISISGKTISVKIDTAGNTENYLQLTASGLKVTGVNQAIIDAITEAFSWHDA